MPARLQDLALRKVYTRISQHPQISQTDVADLIRSANDGVGLSKTEQRDLLAVLQADGSRFDPTAKAALEAYLGVAAPRPAAPPVALPVTFAASEVKQAAEAVLKDGAVGGAEVQDLLQALRDAEGKLTAQRAADLTLLAQSNSPMLSDAGRFLLREALLLPNGRSQFGRQVIDLEREPKLGFDEASALAEEALRGDVDFTSYNSRKAGDLIKWSTSTDWTVEGRDRIQLSLDLADASLAGTLLMLEKERGTLDLADAAAVRKKMDADLAQSRAVDVRWNGNDGSAERATLAGLRSQLALALTGGLKLTPEARLELAKLAGAELPKTGVALDGGPIHSGATIASPHVLANQRYLDSDLALLQASGRVSDFDATFICRINQLVSPPAPAGSLRVSTLLAMEQPEQQRLLSPQEKFLLKRLWRSLELPPAEPATLQLDANTLTSTHVDAHFIRPPPLDLKRSLPIEGDEVMEVDGADLDFLLYTQPCGAMDVSLNFRSSLGKEAVTPLCANPNLSLAQRADFDPNHQLSVTRALVANENLLLVSADGTQQRSVSSGDRFTLPAGPWLARGEQSGWHSFDLPEIKASEEVDLGPYLAWTMANGAMPNRVSLSDLESYATPVTYPNGQVVNRTDDYYRPGALELSLPRGEYRVPGSDLRLLLNNRVSRADIADARLGSPSGKLTQVILIDGQGKPYSLTPNGTTLPDGRKVFVTGSGEAVQLNVSGRQTAVGLIDRVA